MMPYLSRCDHSDSVDSVKGDEYGIGITMRIKVLFAMIRTEFFGKSFDTTILEGSPYADLYRQNMEFYMGQNGTQIGDPAKVAKLYIQLAEMENPPVNMPMGSDSICYPKGLF